MDYKANLWSAIIALAVGIVMVFFSNIALHTVVFMLGIVFIAIAVLNFSFEFSRRRAGKGVTSSTTAMLSSVGAGVLGVLMVLTPASMVNLMVYLFAATIILLGAYKILLLAYAYKPITFPVWFFIMPAILVIGGVVICIVGASKVSEFMILIMGVALIVYAVATFADIAGLVAFRRDLAKAQKAEAGDAASTIESKQPVDVEAKEVTQWPADK